MKFLFLLLLPLQLSAQVEIDTSAVLFKAKLLTISRFGLADEKTTLKDITEQEAVLLYSPSENLLLIRVDYSQSDLLGECSYYLAFNKTTSTFYRLGGFDTLDLSDFFEDLTPDDYQIYDLDFLEESEIDFTCLAKLAELPPGKRIKRKHECFPKCSDVLYQWLVIPNRKD